MSETRRRVDAEDDLEELAEDRRADRLSWASGGGPRIARPAPSKDTDGVVRLAVQADPGALAPTTED
jgi:hypothetical protein